MKRMRIVLVLVVALVTGGLVFQAGLGQAAPGDDDPWNVPTPPTAPAAPKPPKPPKAPKLPKIGAGGGISISIHNGKVQIDGLDQLVAAHLQGVSNMLANNPDIPKDVRDRIVQRMVRVKSIVDKNIKNLDTADLDKLDDQLEKMGDELEKAMEGLDADLAKLGEKLGEKIAKDLSKSFGKDFFKGIAKQKLQFGPNPPAIPGHDDDHDNDDHDSNDSDNDNDNDSDTDDDDLPNASVDAGGDDDVKAAVDQLKNFALKPGQKDAIAQLRALTDAQVAAERKALDEASKQLEDALAKPGTADRDIERYVDTISRHEASIRKLRLLSWVRARRVLDADQVKQLEAATKKTANPTR